MPVRVIAHWLNVPRLLGQTLLGRPATDGRAQRWLERWEIDLGLWHVTFDSRDDLDQMYRAAKRNYLSVLTHTMEIRRNDHAPFSGEEAKNVLDAYKFAKDRGLGDGPSALIEVRDELTHPKDRQQLYQNLSLLGEASRLSSQYLDLVILHRLGYQGEITDRTKLERSSSDSQPVPWHPQPPSSTTPSRAAGRASRRERVGRSCLHHDDRSAATESQLAT
jgi:hypothetical protein